MLLDDAIDSGQTQAGSFANLFGGEEWLKNAAHRRHIHPAPGIAHLQADKRAWPRLGVGLHEALVQFDQSGADRQCATFRHRIARIDGEVHDDLLDHARVRLDRGQFRRRNKLERDRFTQQTLEHLGQVADHIPQVERLGLHYVLAAEHEQLTGQRSCPFSCKVNGLRRIEQFGCQTAVGHHHSRMPLDYREHVVEIVCHARGELANGLHLLRLQQLGFQVQPVGDVFDVAVHDVAGSHGMKRPA